MKILNSKRKKKLIASACVCCKKATAIASAAAALSSADTISSQSGNTTDAEDSSEDEPQQILSDFKAQEQLVVRLIDEVKSMDTDKARKEEKLKESLRDELDIKRHYVEFSRLFETFQNALVDLNLGRIFLMSLPQEILEANPETQAIAIASDHASSLCYVILRQKRSYLRILAKKCDEYRRNNQILSDELKVAREEQKVREKTISEVMEHIQNLKDNFGTIYEDKNGKKSKVVGLQVDISITREPVETN